MARTIAGLAQDHALSLVLHTDSKLQHAVSVHEVIFYTCTPGWFFSNPTFIFCCWHVFLSLVGGATQERTALTAATAHRHGNTKVAEFRQLRNSGRSETERPSLVGVATKGGDHGAELAALLAKEAVTATTWNTSMIAPPVTTGTIANVSATARVITEEANTRAGHILDTADTVNETPGTAEWNWMELWWHWTTGLNIRLEKCLLQHSFPRVNLKKWMFSRCYCSCISDWLVELI